MKMILTERIYKILKRKEVGNMKLKRIISVILIMSILLGTISPISFAVYSYGPGISDSYPIAVDEQIWNNFKESASGYNGNPFEKGLYIQPIEIKVSQAGVYEISNLHGGETTSYVICAQTNGGLAPLPVATYGNGSSELKLNQYNNSSLNTTSVYLDPNTTYQILLIGDSTQGNSIKLPSENDKISVNVKYIDPPVEGMNAYETTTSSLEYTCTTGITSELFSGVRGNNTQPVNLSSVCSQLGEGVSGDEIGGQNKEETADEGEASWFEKIIAWFGLALAEGIRALIHQFLDAEVSIDIFVFNEYPNTKLSIFSSLQKNSEDVNNYLKDSGIIDSDGQEGVLTKYFNFFRTLAIAIYIVMLLATGVMILAKSTGKEKEKYKSMVIDWIKGIVILAFFPYIMKYTIVANNAIVKYLADLRDDVGKTIGMEIKMPASKATSIEAAKKLGLTDSKKLQPADMMDYMRVKAWEDGRVAYFIVYAFLLKELIGFIFIYYKRLLTVLFLIFIFPLVTVTYALDKSGNGRADAFGNWFKEFFLNVFLQAFQAANYIIIMPIIFILASESKVANIILLMIGITYISKGDVLLRSMFSKMSGGGAGTTKNLSEAVKTIVNVKLAKEVAGQVKNVGKRVGQLKNNVYDMQNRYYDLQDAKKNRSLESEMRWKESYLNPENQEINDVAGNMRKVLSLLATPEERKKALDQIAIAQNDPRRRDLFEAAMSNLNRTAKIDPVTGAIVDFSDFDKIGMLLMANQAINETINGNEGMNGALTEREINVNANILYDVMSGGQFGVFTDLRDWANSKTLTDRNHNPILRSNGSAVTVGSKLYGAAQARHLSDSESQQLEKVQNFMGNVTGIDTDNFGLNGVSRTAHGPLEVKEHSNSERVRARSIERRFGTAGSTGESKAKQERAANLVARMQSYKFMIDSGTSEGMSATEAKQLAREWRTLQNDSDTGVQRILSQVGDASITGAAMEANVGFTLEQFETMASLAVLSDTNNLVGTDEEKQEMINDSIGHVVKVSKDRDSDKVSKNMIQRAEIDSIIDDFYQDVQITQNSDGTKTVTVNVDASDYIRTNETQEQIRDRNEYKKARDRVASEYDKNARRQSVAQARGNLIRSATRAAGSAVSVGAIPLNVASAGAAMALYGGASGDTNNPTAYVGAAGVGMGAENTIESLVPGTLAADKSKKSVGGRIDGAAKRGVENLSYSDVEINENLARQERVNNGAKARIEKYKDYIS